MEKQSQDRYIREKVKEQDMDFQQQLRNQMAEEQKMLKGYFKEFKKPIDHDPKKIRRDQSAAVDRSVVLKQAFRPFQLFYTFYKFWNMECSTPQETHTLKLCKKNLLGNMMVGTAVSMSITLFISFKYRSVFTPGMHALSIGTALMSGIVYGALSSTKFTLEQFQKLGAGYELGRTANHDIQRYRMDKNRNI